MTVLIILTIVFVLSSGVATFTGRALLETFKCVGKELYWDIRTSFKK